MYALRAAAAWAMYKGPGLKAKCLQRAVWGHRESQEKCHKSYLLFCYVMLCYVLFCFFFFFFHFGESLACNVMPIGHLAFFPPGPGTHEEISKA